MSKITVVVPVYKVEKYLNRCVESILAQTYKDFELILVDDGSPDNCGKICDEYASKDSRIKVIHKKNGGLSDARNAGIDWSFRNSNSEWITFIDSDDWIHPQYLEILYNAVISNCTNISVCKFERIGDICDFCNIEYSNINNVMPDDFFMNNNVNAVVAWGKLYKKSLFTNVRYPVGKIHEDEFTTHKLLFQCKKITFLKTVLYFYFINDNSITSQLWQPKSWHRIQAIKQRLKYFYNVHNIVLYNWNADLYVYMLMRDYELLLKSRYCNIFRVIKYRFIILNAIYKYQSILKVDKKVLLFKYEKIDPNFMRHYWMFRKFFRLK